MPEWLQQVLPAGLILVLAAYIWRKHEERDQERNEDVWDQIGRDSEHGMRKNVHDIPGLSLRTENLERRMARIERHLNGHMRDDEE